MYVTGGCYSAAYPPVFALLDERFTWLDILIIGQWRPINIALMVRTREGCAAIGAASHELFKVWNP